MNKMKLNILRVGIVVFSCLLLIISCNKDKAIEPTSVSDVLITNDCPDIIYYSSQIVSMLNENCVSCHSGSNTGFPPDLTNHSEVSSNASSVLSSIQSGYMPQGAPKLADSIIQQFQCWINQGKVNN